MKLPQKTVANVLKEQAHHKNLLCVKVKGDTYVLVDPNSPVEIEATFYLYKSDKGYSILFVRVLSAYPRKVIRIGECLADMEDKLNDLVKAYENRAKDLNEK